MMYETEETQVETEPTQEASQETQVEETAPVTEETQEPGPVPYDRFSEVNTKNKTLATENEQLRQQVYASQQRQQPQYQPQPQQPQEVFNQETDRGIEQIVQRANAPLQQKLDQQNAAMIVNEMSKDPNWEANQQAVFQKFQQMGLDGAVIDTVEKGVNVAKMLLNDVMVSGGAYEKQATAAAQAKAETQQVQRNAATGPKGTAGRKSEAKDISDMTYEQRQQYYSQVMLGNTEKPG